MTQTDLATAAPRLGRKRDHTRDAEILESALDVLAETGYDGMTIDMVATRAKAGKATLYRRWPSKPELVLDAVACMKGNDIDLGALPDTGTLRGDLVAMVKPRTIEDAQQKLRVMAGVMSLLGQNPGLAEAAREAIVEPRLAINRMFLRRAIDRGEISADIDIERIAAVSQSMGAFRMLMLQKPVDREFVISVIDGIVLPAVGIDPAA